MCARGSLHLCVHVYLLAGCDDVHVSACVPNFLFSSGSLLAVKGFEMCDFKLLHVRSQFDQCLLQLSLASGHTEPLIDESFV